MDLHDWTSYIIRERVMVESGACQVKDYTVYTGRFTTRFGELPGFVELHRGASGGVVLCYVKKVPEAIIYEKWHVAQLHLQWRPGKDAFFVHFREGPRTVAEGIEKVEAFFNSMEVRDDP